MKWRLLLFILCCSLFVSQNINAQGWQWAKGEDNGGGCEGFFCTTDAPGSVYVTGTYGELGFTIFGNDTLTGYGDFVVKYDSSGNLKWAIGIYSSHDTALAYGEPNVGGLVTDLFGNEYLLGSYAVTIYIDGDSLITPGPKGGNYCFIAKIDSTGNVKWIKNIGNLSPEFGNNGGNLITSDLQGKIYITCPFSGNPTIGGYSITNVGLDSTTDILVAKFDSSANVIWAKSYGGKEEELPIGISVTSLHRIYLSGYFNSDTLVFGSTSLFYNVSSLYYATYLTKLDSSGNPIWAIIAADTSTGRGGGLAVNLSEKVFINGSSGNYGNGYLAKFDSTGSELWVKYILGPNVQTWGIAIDPCENVWVNGSLYGADTIDGHIINSPSGSSDPIFITAWDSSGSYLQAQTLTSGGDDLNDIAMDRFGNVFVESDFAISPFIVGNDSLYGTIGEPNFVAKYNPDLGCRGNNNDLELQKVPIQQQYVFIYPNPATNELTITSTDNINTVAISNLLGQTIYTQHYNTQEVQVDVPDFPAGIYFVKVNGTEVRKFVKE